MYAKLHEGIVVGALAKIFIGLGLVIILMQLIESLEHHQSVLHPFLIFLQMSALGLAHVDLECPLLCETLAAECAGVKIAFHDPLAVVPARCRL